MSLRTLAFAILLLAYAALTLAVILPSPVQAFDSYLNTLDLRHHYPEWKKWISFYVVLGQRGPATLFFLPWFVWMARRAHSSRPLVMLGTSLVLLNVSVGVVKYALGRVGPLHTHKAYAFFYWGSDIFPSGHTSNVVVLYGLMAMIATRYRKSMFAAASFLSVTIGAGTVYLNTHWFSDVVAGWIAGALVLVALPWAMPTAQRWTDALWARVRDRLAARRAMRDRTAAPVSPMPVTSRRVTQTHRGQGKATPASSGSCSHNLAATVESFDPRDESTHGGDPRNSPIPSGP